MIISDKKIGLVLLLGLLLLGMDNGGKEPEERQQLEQQKKALSTKIESLRLEQDFLLFRKELYAADSKYLILNIQTGKGELRYKNRLLKSFSVMVSSKARWRAVPGGVATVTRKAEGSGKRQVIQFGKSFILQVKPKDDQPLPQDRAALPRLYVYKKDLQSIFYATEMGSKAYILK